MNARSHAASLTLTLAVLSGCGQGAPTDGQAPAERPRAAAALFAPDCDLSLESLDVGSLRELSVQACGQADYRPLRGAVRLEALSVHHPDLTDLSFLYGAAALERLTLESSHVSDLTPLAFAPALTELVVLDTPLTDLSPLAGAERLRRLDVTDTYVTDLTPLAGLAALEELHAPHTRVADLTPLEGLSRLRLVDVRGGGVTDPTPLLRAGLAEGAWVDLTGNCLDFSDLATSDAIAALRARGVRVETDGQTPGCDAAYYD